MTRPGETALTQRGASEGSPGDATPPYMANALKRLRLERGWTHEEAAERMGVSRGQFIKLERGERGMTERTIFLAAKAFSVSRSEILSDEQAPASVATEGAIRDLPVYTAAEGGAGSVVVSTDPIEYVPRPWYVRNVRDAYAVMVVGDSMVPAFEPGDLAIINPRLPPMRNKDTIFVSGERVGEFTATIKRLQRWTDKDWIVCQFNPPRGGKAEFTLPRQQWTKALRVVGKHYGG